GSSAPSLPPPVVRSVLHRDESPAGQGGHVGSVGAGRGAPSPADTGRARDGGGHREGHGESPVDRRGLMAVSITFLGGLGEIGRNCAALEVDGRICLIDCGLMFPEEDMLGVDLVFPDWSWLLERRDDVDFVVLTHGHEDHMGALAYFLRDIDVPVYGSRLALEFARG